MTGTAATILLVEDNRMDIELTLDAFREHRLSNQVQVVRTGEDALAYLFGEDQYADRSRFPLPDLVLLDIKLPGIDGIEVLKLAKQQPVVRRVPIVILTSSSDEGDRILSYDHGANSYLIKPVQFDDFIEAVRSIESYWLTLNVNAPPTREPAAGESP